MHYHSLRTAMYSDAFAFAFMAGVLFVFGALSVIVGHVLVGAFFAAMGLIVTVAAFAA